ncbi:hypothetical protein WJX72_011337 [[Myrmecia] bisecta]|uniref:D-aminoacyl-tRNA deacylase n=1 Tax=[Myrmecia] bisecta TaxID=41462 RepID=A0AAW1Q2P1_9CHLO
MRAVVQRVKSASIEVEGKVVSNIGPGLLALVGVRAEDTEKDAEFICRKILRGRLFTNGENDRAWDQNVVQKGYGVLVVSQFTLYGFLKGNKPDFHVAMAPQQAQEFYSSFVERMRREYAADRVHDGIFGAMMNVSLVNDGPVTMCYDSENPKG